MREGVAVWPAKTERIMGRLSLVNQHSVLFICWLPYSEGQLRKDGTFLSPAGESAPSVQSRGKRSTSHSYCRGSLLAHDGYRHLAHEVIQLTGMIRLDVTSLRTRCPASELCSLRICRTGAPHLLRASVCISACSSDNPAHPCSRPPALKALLAVDRTMYAVHPIPLSEVKAIRKQAPKFGWQFIVVVLSNGLTLPPLYFTTGGVKALFAALRQVSHALVCAAMHVYGKASHAAVWLLMRSTLLHNLQDGRTGACSQSLASRFTLPGCADRNVCCAACAAGAQHG